MLRIFLIFPSMGMYVFTSQSNTPTMMRVTTIVINDIILAFRFFACWVLTADCTLACPLADAVPEALCTGRAAGFDSNPGYENFATAPASRPCGSLARRQSQRERWQASSS